MAIWILDPGHGGNDFGVVGTDGGKESDIVLEAVLEAKKHLERNGEKVILTRSNDKNINIEERIKIANESEGKYFVSFHMNEHINNKEKGVKVLKVGNKYIEEEDRLARLVRDEIFSGFRTENKGVMVKDLEDYKGIDMISIVILCDYLTNEDVEKNFDSKKYGRLVAKACLAMVDKVLILQPKSQPKRRQKMAWRLCVGYYNSFDSAAQAMKEMNDRGIPNAYVVPYDGR